MCWELWAVCCMQCQACDAGVTYEARHVRGPVPSIEAADLGPCLPKDCVVRCDGEVAHHVQYVAAAHCIARHLRDDRLWQPPYLHLCQAHIAGDAGVETAAQWPDSARHSKLLLQGQFQGEVHWTQVSEACLQVQHIEARHTIAAHVAALAAHVLVATAAKRCVTFACSIARYAILGMACLHLQSPGNMPGVGKPNVMHGYHDWQITSLVYL